MLGVVIGADVVAVVVFAGWVGGVRGTFLKFCCFSPEPNPCETLRGLTLSFSIYVAQHDPRPLLK